MSIAVYLIHIEPPFRHKAHYIGATRRNPIERFREHERGEGAQLTKQAVAAGSKLVIARIWFDASWEFERKLKGRSVKPHCPICQGEADLSAAGG